MKRCKQKSSLQDATNVITSATPRVVSKDAEGFISTIDALFAFESEELVLNLKSASWARAERLGLATGPVAHSNAGFIAKEEGYR